MKLLLLLLTSLWTSNAIVNFSHSALYDVYDFNQPEVHIAKCDAGCVMYASIMDFNPNPFPGGVDPYSFNLFIHDNNNGTDIIRFADLASQRGDGGAKIPLIIEGPASISIINNNNVNDEKYTIVLYVVEKEIADSIAYEIYDAKNTYYIDGTDKIVTIMSAKPFRLDGHGIKTNFSVQMRLTGFDNALDGNTDECELAFETTVQGKPVDPAFSIDANSPIISLVMQNWDKDTDITPWPLFNHERKIQQNGFISTPGWNGCSKPHSGGIQTFRSPYDKPTDVFYIDFDNAFDRRQVELHVLPHFGNVAQKLRIDEGAGNTPTVRSQFRTKTCVADKGSYSDTGPAKYPCQPRHQLRRSGQQVKATATVESRTACLITGTRKRSGSIW